MRNTLKLLVGSLMFSGIAHAAVDPAFERSGINEDCQNKIMTEVETRCNGDSLAEEGNDRMNPCQDFSADIAEGGALKGQIEAGGYAGDADGYWYVVSIVNADRCEFSLFSEQ